MGAILFKDLEIGHRFCFADEVRVVMRKTSSRTYCPTYNNYDIRYIDNSADRVYDVEPKAHEVSV